MISAGQLVALSLRGVREHPGRAILSAIGIAIGVCALVLMLAIAQAVQAAVAHKLGDLGSNQYLVRPRGGAGGPHGATRGARIDLDDAAALAASPALAATAAAVTCLCEVASPLAGGTQAVIGTGPAMFALRHWRLARGRALSESDEAAGERVVVIGSGVARRLFDTPAVGGTLRVNGLVFRVIGVLAGEGMSFDGSDLAELVVIPLRFAPRGDAQGRDGVSYLSVQGRADRSSAETVDLIQAIVHDRHAVTQPGTDDLDVLNLAAIGEAADGIGQALGAAFFAVALVSLLVGGIGIMNVMLATSTERVHEIGVRLAIGATPFGIFLQHLLESVLICATAAAAGEAIAAGVARLITATGRLDVHVGAGDAFTGAACACAIGLVFGLAPARRAARVPPNVALRER